MKIYNLKTICFLTKFLYLSRKRLWRKELLHIWRACDSDKSTASSRDRPEKPLYQLQRDVHLLAKKLKNIFEETNLLKLQGFEFWKGLDILVIEWEVVVRVEENLNVNQILSVIYR